MTGSAQFVWYQNPQNEEKAKESINLTQGWVKTHLAYG